MNEIVEDKMKPFFVIMMFVLSAINRQKSVRGNGVINLEITEC